MLTATTESAIRALVYLSLRDETGPASPRQIAEAVGGSPTYMAKIAGILRKAGIVRAHSGAAGGIELSRNPSIISLLDIVQACQGLVIADYCVGLGDATSPDACAFHQAMYELHTNTIRTLSRWTLKKLAAQPLPRNELAGSGSCRMANLYGSCSKCEVPAHAKSSRSSTRKPRR